MDPINAAASAAGLVSLAFQLFAGCIQGFILLSTAHNLGKDAITILCMLNLQELALAIVRKVRQLHRSGWLHKDLRSENILFFPEDSMIKEGKYNIYSMESSLDSRFDSTLHPNYQNNLPEMQNMTSIDILSALGEPSASFNAIDAYSLRTIPVDIAEWRALKYIVQSVAYLAQSLVQVSPQPGSSSSRNLDLIAAGSLVYHSGFSCTVSASSQEALRRRRNARIMAMAMKSPSEEIFPIANVVEERGGLLGWANGELGVAVPSAKDKRYFEVRDGVNHTVFEHAATGATLAFVTNSGICETTPGVNQYSGYLTVGTENGPCHFVNGASTPSLNPYSFNEYANMLYIDQPIGVGFSYGTDSVTSTVTAAPYVWTLIQAFFTQFPQYESRDFGLFTESYGGHYGPEFASYFESQNAKIAAGTVTGETIDLIALGINNGWYDPIIQYKAYVDFSYNNTYKALISSSQHTSYTNTYTRSCLPLLEECTSTTGSNSACENADDTCYDDIEGPLSEVGNFDVYDIREPSNDPYPPETYVTYLQSSSVMSAIGAKATYSECPDAPYEKFENTGDDARSFLSALSTVVQSGITVLIWAGDADWICNWFGGLASANAVTYSGSTAFNAAPVKNYTVSGVSSGTFKTVDNLSWLRVFGSGHEVPYYQPATALQVFTQTMQKLPISST
ncbi:hypothetical protein B7494_g565 [Chlorociboria aeruginascens]|nr:hypothetical protein B7494_g565 [Chlorociboria aeruginascens]